eukprot:937659-Amphidinium_carterae.1
MGVLIFVKKKKKKKLKKKKKKLKKKKKKLKNLAKKNLKWKWASTSSLLSGLESNRGRKISSIAAVLRRRLENLHPLHSNWAT